MSDYESDEKEEFEENHRHEDASHAGHGSHAGCGMHGGGMITWLWIGLILLWILSYLR